MYRTILDAVTRELSGRLALRQVGEVARFHRIQASPGIRDAATYCVGQLEQAGLEVEVLTFPADGSTRFWGNVMHQEWHCRGAELDLVAPEGSARRLASFAENPISIVQRSYGTPPEGVTAELVAVDDADQPRSYDGVDVKGKIVLAAGDLGKIRQLAVEERGALGIVTDHLTEAPPARPAMSLPDARQYHSFWWIRTEKKCFGFVVSPREGAALRKLCRNCAQKGEGAPVVRARVDADLYPGQMEVVSAVLPGEADQEVLVVAHLCHPQPSANDNASGAGLSLEVARTLGELVRSGKLPAPPRSIRFLLVPEMTGTYAFLASREDDLGRYVAAVNLDMVGQDQEKCGSTLQVEFPPRAMASFTGDLMAEILDTIATGASNFAGTASYSTFRWAVTPFSGGSDHYILSDPTVGVPCPMLIQWPDRFYHTDHDTMDKVDPSMMAVVGRLTATYSYFLASAGNREAAWLAERMVSRLAGRMASATRDLAGGKPSDLIIRRLRFLHDRCLEDLGALVRLGGREGDDEDLKLILKACGEDVSRVLEVYERSVQRQSARPGVNGNGPVAAADDAAAMGVVPRRLVRGPVSLRAFMHLLPDELRNRFEAMSLEKKGGSTLLIHALYWMDGERTLSEVADLVELETGLRDDEYLRMFVEVLRAIEFVTTSGRTGGR